MNRICKPGPIVTSVAAIIITISSQLESDYPASFRVTAVPSVGPSDTLSTSVSGHLVADTMAIESPDNETSWRGSMMSRLPWEVDHRESDSHTSICDRQQPSGLTQKHQQKKNKRTEVPRMLSQIETVRLRFMLDANIFLIIHIFS